MKVGRRVAILAASTWLATGCGGAGNQPPAAPVLRVVTAVYPFAQAVTQVGQGKVQVVDVVPPGDNPLTYQVTAAGESAIRSAGLVIDVGDGFQPSFEAAARSAGHVLDVEAAVRSSNPYPWLDPNTMLVAVGAIATAMENVDPAAAASFRDGAQAFEQEISSDGIDYQSTLATCPKTTVFTADAAFSTMARDYGLKDVVIGTGAAPARTGPAAAEVDGAGATAVFAETWVDDGPLDAVAARAHVKVDTLDTLVGPPAGGWPHSSYITLLESDLGTFSSALGCDDLGTGT